MRKKATFQGTQVHDKDVVSSNRQVIVSRSRPGMSGNVQ